MNIAMATLIAGLGLKPISAGFDIDLSRPMIFHIVNLTDGNVEKQIITTQQKMIHETWKNKSSEL